MFRYKVSEDASIPVRLLKADGTAETGIAFGSVTATLRKADGTFVTVSPADASYWSEAIAGAYASKGVYVLKVLAAHMGLVGPTMIAINGTNGSAVAEFTVVANIEKDTYDRIGAPVGVSIAADISHVHDDLAAVNTTITLINTMSVAIKGKTDNLPANTATSIAAIPTNPLLSTDVRLPAVGSGKVVASISDLLVPPSIVDISTGVWNEIIATVNGAEAARVALGDSLGYAKSAAVDAGYTRARLPLIEQLIYLARAIQGANRVSDLEVRDSFGRMISSRVRVYDTAADAEIRNQAGLLGTYTLTAVWNLDGSCETTVKEVLV